MSTAIQPSARLTKVLTIGDQQVSNILNDNVKLALFSTGRATSTVISDKEPSGLVELHIGYNAKQLTSCFSCINSHTFCHRKNGLSRTK